MTYYKDLTKYEYSCERHWSRTKNVGWLDGRTDFEKQKPNDEILSLLWKYCKVAVRPTRGGHMCEICGNESPIFEERDGERLLLGTAEIRVFSKSGHVYAAPNAIYHYVMAHEYKPPDEFTKALFESGFPGQKYFDMLDEVELEWMELESRDDTHVIRFC